MNTYGKWIYSDEYIEVYYTGCDQNGLYFLIRNVTELEATFAFSTIALDDISYDIMGSDVYYSIWVAPEGYGTMLLILPDEFTTEFSEMSGEFLYCIENEDIFGEYKFTDIHV